MKENHEREEPSVSLAADEKQADISESGRSTDRHDSLERDKNNCFTPPYFGVLLGVILTALSITALIKDAKHNHLISSETLGHTLDPTRYLWNGVVVALAGCCGLSKSKCEMTNLLCGGTVVVGGIVATAIASLHVSSLDNELKRIQIALTIFSVFGIMFGIVVTKKACSLLRSRSGYKMRRVSDLTHETEQLHSAEGANTNTSNTVHCTSPHKRSSYISAGLANSTSSAEEQQSRLRREITSTDSGPVELITTRLNSSRESDKAKTHEIFGNGNVSKDVSSDRLRKTARAQLLHQTSAFKEGLAGIHQHWPFEPPESPFREPYMLQQGLVYHRLASVELPSMNTSNAVHQAALGLCSRSNSANEMPRSIEDETRCGSETELHNTKGQNGQESYTSNGTVNWMGNRMNASTTGLHTSRSRIVNQGVSRERRLAATSTPSLTEVHSSLKSFRSFENDIEGVKTSDSAVANASDTTPEVVLLPPTEKSAKATKYGSVTFPTSAAAIENDDRLSDAIPLVEQPPYRDQKYSAHVYTETDV